MPATTPHATTTTTRHPRCIMILGATNDTDGALSLMARLRLKQGQLEYQRHRDTGCQILLTGGYGAHFNTTPRPHTHYARLHLENELHIPPHAILPETVESANTVEDFEKALPILQKYNFAKLIIVTSTFHTPRALYIARHALHPIPETTITTAPAPDDALAPDHLAQALAHETRALAYLQTHYPPARRDNAQP